MTGLTREALLERRKGIGGSDAAKIMDRAQWPALWADKTGRCEPEDLSDVFAVQLGLVTEELNLDWYERRTGRKVTRRGEVCVHPEYSFLRCTLDGWDAEYSIGRPAVVQAKHVNAFSKIDEVVARYSTQVMHEMLVTTADLGVLSVIVGTNEPVREPITFDEFFAYEYLDLCMEFWAYVEKGELPPGSGEKITAPKPIEEMRVVDMLGSNQWSEAAALWLHNRKAAKVFDEAVKTIKGMVDEDVREAHGYGVKATRSKRGLTITEKK